MIRRSQGRSTVPQIFINNRGIGGCDDLFALDQQGQLNPLLGLAS
jgi:glutaredoxin 3